MNRAERTRCRGGRFVETVWFAAALLPLLGLVGHAPVLARGSPPGVAAQPGVPATARADFGDETASADARRVADWVAASGDNLGRPFIIIDKIAAKVFVFGPNDTLRGAAAALLGLARGDGSTPGIGHRKLSEIGPAERTTPAGRFEASLGEDMDQDVLWIDYDQALSMHRVIIGKPADRRHARLASPTASDNRISFGCVNVPVPFYDKVVEPSFRGIVGIVYILPETKPVDAVFAMHPRAPTAGGDRHMTSASQTVTN